MSEAMAGPRGRYGRVYGRSFRQFERWVRDDLRPIFGTRPFAVGCYPTADPATVECWVIWRRDDGRNQMAGHTLVRDVFARPFGRRYYLHLTGWVVQEFLRRGRIWGTVPIPCAVASRLMVAVMRECLPGARCWPWNALLYRVEQMREVA